MAGVTSVEASLDAWLYGTRVARLSRAGGGRLTRPVLPAPNHG
jgi:hypothetical protein